jgi:hypothetical protein
VPCTKPECVDHDLRAASTWSSASHLVTDGYSGNDEIVDFESICTQHNHIKILTHMGEKKVVKMIDFLPLRGLEPRTLALLAPRSNQLSYKGCRTPLDVNAV